METSLKYEVYVSPPDSFKYNPNVTLHIDIEKVSLKGLSSGSQDRLTVYYQIVETSQRSFNYSPPGTERDISLKREVLPADILKQRLSQMPGFKITWYYSGMDVESSQPYSNALPDPQTRAFVRNYSNIFPK